MAQVYNRLEVDVRTETIDIITAVQNDSNSRFLDVFLLDNGVPINLTGHEVRIYGKKADGTEIYNDGEITEETNGRCQFELTSQALAVAQDLEVQIILFKDNVEILSTQPFKIHVVKSLISSGSVESSNEYGALVVLYQNLYEAYDLMVEIAAGIKDVAAAVEGTAESNNNMIQACMNYTDYKIVNIPSVETEVLNITGSGFVGNLGINVTSGGLITIKIYIDDELFFDFSRNVNTIISFGGGTSYALLRDMSALKQDNPSQPLSASAVRSILSFTKNIRIVASAAITDTSNSIQIIYGLVG
ncbi:BppU family phage baseplate upper protein [Anaerotignum sp. MB30-C6]|uniref:BppU family phage baseplate upper protein n=1 Tax=Anaerotignum sp. MB30-C6 TaxID=3070814 RepID=UPI0027DD7A20|nr:BppU family phage baseplate upper protein [Anaerotignum sp. MB30-C6]WMI81851.1 BppU family phage baseplate upper protein [Anaerotignum sp. MB30-C6]